MSTTTDVTNLIINKLTKAQYDAITNPDPTQLYFIIDNNEYATVSDLPQPSNTAPGMDGTAAAGVAATYSRSDHIHPTDSTRAPINSPSFTGQPMTPTPVGDTITISGIQNIVLTGFSDADSSGGKYKEIGTISNLNLDEANTLNITFDGTNYGLPLTAALYDTNDNLLGVTWGAATIEDTTNAPNTDFSTYPVGITYQASTNKVMAVVPSSYTTGSISVNSYTEKPDGTKIVNVNYLDSVLSNFASTDVENDETVLQAFIDCGLIENVLVDENDNIIIDEEPSTLMDVHDYMSYLANNSGNY